MTCQTIQPDWGTSVGQTIACPAEATRRVRSRDFGEAELAMCDRCAADAIGSGMFEGVR
jgi:hypothetical protein